MRNGDYWRERMRILNEALLDRGYEYLQNLERQFEAAAITVERDLAAWYVRLTDNNEISLLEAKRMLSSSELKEFHWTVEEYIRYGKENAIDGRWMKELENASTRVHISRLDSIKLLLQQQAERLYGNQLDGVDALAREIYADGYYHTAFELQKGFSVGWSLQCLNDGLIEKALARPWTTDGRTFRDRCWVNKQTLVDTVNTQLTQMIMRGDSPDRAISAISKQFGVSKSKAGRLVMTESAAFSSAAQKDCYEALDVERYRLVETLDTDTCETCGELDGRVFRMSDYQVGLTAPPFHPWCRGCTCPHFDDMEGMRVARGADGKSCRMPGDMKYPEWKRKFVDGVEKPGRIGIMKDSGLSVIPITDEAIARVPVVECGALTQEQSKLLSQKHRELLEYVKDDEAGTEAGAYYDMSLNLLDRYKGEMGKIKGRAQTVQSIFMHNHPSGVTFTLHDVSNFATSENLTIMTAVGNNGSVYLLEKTSKFNFAGLFHHLADKLNLFPDYESNVQTYITFMDRFLEEASKYGIQYQKVESGQ